MRLRSPCPNTVHLIGGPSLADRISDTAPNPWFPDRSRTFLSQKCRPGVRLEFPYPGDTIMVFCGHIFQTKELP